MSKTKTTEMSEKENSKNVATELNSSVGASNEEAKKAIVKERKKAKKQAEPTIEDKIKSLQARGFDHNRIAAMLMVQKSLVKQVLE